MSILASPGKTISLNLQLSDGEESLPKVVKAFIKDDSGNLLNSLELTHKGKGLFINDDAYLMPDKKVIFSQYVVYEIDGVTEDIFYPITYEAYQNVNDLDIGSSSSSYADAGAIEVFIEDDLIEEIAVIVQEAS